MFAVELTYGDSNPNTIRWEQMENYSGFEGEMETGWVADLTSSSTGVAVNDVVSIDFTVDGEIASEYRVCREDNFDKNDSTTWLDNLTNVAFTVESVNVDDTTYTYIKFFVQHLDKFGNKDGDAMSYTIIFNTVED